LNKGEKGAEDDGLISRQGTKAINWNDAQLTAPVGNECSRSVAHDRQWIQLDVQVTELERNCLIYL